MVSVYQVTEPGNILTTRCREAGWDLPQKMDQQMIAQELTQGFSFLCSILLAFGLSLLIVFMDMTSNTPGTLLTVIPNENIVICY